MSPNEPDKQNEPSQSSHPPAALDGQNSSDRERQIRLEEKVIALDRTVSHLTSTARVGLTFVTTIVSVIALLIGIFLNIQIFSLMQTIKLGETLPPTPQQIEALTKTLGDLRHELDELKSGAANEPK